jgi:lipoprotein-anchoring transpeptidase ErfK/SrfK
MPKARPIALLGLAAAFALAGCGSDDEGAGGEEPSGAATTTTTTTTAPAVDRGADSARLWFTSGEQFHPVERELPAKGSALEPTVTALLEGPTSGERAAEVESQTQIPEGTELVGLAVAEDGTAVVDLSEDFLEGVPEEAAQRNREQDAELDARLGQVTYTLTQFEDVESTRVLAGGKVIEPRVSRQDYAAPAQGPAPVTKPRGAKLPGTRQIQKKLAKLSYLPKKAVDGLAGYRTQQAVIAFQSWEGLDRDGVVGPATSAALSTARRPKPRPGGPARRIEVYNERGVTLLIVGGRTKRAIHTSSGAPGTATPTGRYSVFRKELQSWSVPFSTWLPYASYFNNGIAFHEYPDVPTYPASHGCVRVPAPEAPGVYAFASMGTVVVVYQ